MKLLIGALSLFLLLGITAQSQTIKNVLVADQLEAYLKLKVAGVDITQITTDNTFATATHQQLATKQSTKEWVLSLLGPFASVSAPGPNKVYGTNAGGVKGWQPASNLTPVPPIAIASNNISITQATSSQNGYLSSADWMLFSNKVPGSRTIFTAKSITGGGDLSTDHTFELVGDNAFPLPNSYYGTNASGVKGFHQMVSGAQWKEATAFISGGETVMIVSEPITLDENEIINVQAIFVAVSNTQNAGFEGQFFGARFHKGRTFWQNGSIAGTLNGTTANTMYSLEPDFIANSQPIAADIKLATYFDVGGVANQRIELTGFVPAPITSGMSWKVHFLVTRTPYADPF